MKSAELVGNLLKEGLYVMKPNYKCYMAVFVLLSLTLFCDRDKQQIQEIEGPSIIVAHTSGTVSRDNPIRIRFAADMVDSSRINAPLERSPITLKPKVAGVAVWVDERVLEFRAEKLERGQRYQATVDLRELMEEPVIPSEYVFDFDIIKQSFEIYVDGLKSVSVRDREVQQLRGRLITADVEYAAEVEKVVTAEHAGEDLPVKWQHLENNREHAFIVEGIRRGQQESEVILRWDGRPIDVDKTGKRAIAVPPLSAFKVMQTRAVQGDEQYIAVHFSDPLDREQNLAGLIRAGDVQELGFTIDGNIIKVYNPSLWNGEIEVRIEPGIRNANGQRLDTGGTFSVVFEEIKPQVRFAGKGVIFPTTQGLTVPIETVNLRAVQVEAVQVFEQNIPQFLQVNSLDGDAELQRVGRIVWQKTLPLDYSADKRNRWIRYGLDVSPLVTDNPGGLYRLRLFFKRKHVVFNCADVQTDEDRNESDEDEADWDSQSESSYWDSYEDEDFDWYEYYSQRENPCHPAYYRDIGGHSIVAARNVLVSDIGLMAKKASSDSLLVVVTDIKTARPIEGARVKIRDYQQQLLQLRKTDRQGMVRLATERRPFLIEAFDGNHMGYLRLAEGQSLPVSHFDVGGQTIQKGLKGYLYGERGVWRPGDKIYLTFILDDRDNRLPDNFPVLFELKNSRGQVVETVRKTSSVNGFYTFIVETDSDAPTGNWLARVDVGGAVFEKVIKIETVMPNRLKIDLDFAEESLSRGSINTELSAMWLHGAVAKNLKADIELSFSPRKTVLPNYDGYSFDDPVRVYEPESRMIFEGRLDSRGKAQVQAMVQADNLSPGMLTANFRTRVFEPSGAFSVDRLSMPYHPFDRYVGIRLPKGDRARGMLLTDTTHTVDVVVVDKSGTSVPRTAVEVKLYKIKWRWWWEKGTEALADYVGTSSFLALITDTLEVHAGKGTWNFKIDYPSWGRYLVRARDLSGGHETGQIAYIDWPGWAGRAQKDVPGAAAVLTFASDKEEYSVGEKIVLTIPAAPEGRALVSIESSNSILKTDWVTGSGESMRYEFTATGEMTPNVYASVTLVQPHLQTKNDLPVRLYGVIPIRVTDQKTRLSPLIRAAEVLVPEEVAEIAVSEENGRPMTYTLALVDEGLLDLTRFSTPDPWQHFYQREALGVKTWDLYDDIAGAFGGKLEKLLAIGGGEEVEIGGQKKADRFPPMVRFLGPFELKRNRENKHEVDMPRYVGSVRIMVVAGQDGAYGSTEKQAFVRKPLMVLGTLPRVLGPLEEVDLPVAVFALEEKVRDVDIEVSASGPLNLSGPVKKRVTFNEPGDQIVSFSLKADSSTGIASINITATGAGERAEQIIQIDIRAPNVPVVDVLDATLAPGKTWRQKVRLPGIGGTNSAVLEISRIPPIDLGRRLKFLIRYPHGCIEQTTSAVFPQLYLASLLNLSPEKQHEIERNIKGGIDRIRSFQTSSGGFAYWPGNTEAQEWVSTYAGHFLIEAEKIGYQIPSGVLTQWKNYQRKQALSWVTGPVRSELIQAYRLYTLALINASELGAMNRLREEKDLPTTARWRLAAAYQLAGQPEAAEEIVKSARTEIPVYRELGNTYGSELRDKAMILEAMCLMKNMKEAVRLSAELSAALSSQKWLSTQSTAYALVALAQYAGVSGDAKDMEIAVSWFSGRRETISAASPIVQKDLDIGDLLNGEIYVENIGEITLYPRLILEGLPRPGEERAASYGMDLQVRYTSLTGDEIDPGKLEQGEDIVTEVTVRHTGSSGEYEEVALSTVFPSGWEIRNQRFDPGVTGDISTFEYQDVRDDRVYTYFDIAAENSKTFRFLVNASYLGRYYLPMITVETMYDASINARVPGRWVDVIEPGSGE